MTEWVFQPPEANTLEVARQEHELAREHFRQVSHARRPLNREDDDKFRDAHRRMMLAGDRLRALL